MLLGQRAGQGTVLASPMVMATVMASIQAGRTVVPRPLEQVDVAVPDAAPPLAPAEAKALRSMLRTVVTSGSRCRFDMMSVVIWLTRASPYDRGMLTVAIIRSSASR